MRLISIDVGWKNPAYLLCTYDPATRELALDEFLPIPPVTRKRPGLQLIIQKIMVDGAERLIAERGLTADRAAPLEVVCEGQVGANMMAWGLQAYMAGYFRGLGRNEGCAFHAFPAVQKFLHVPAWAAAYRALPPTGRKVHKVLAVELGRRVVSGGAIADDLGHAVRRVAVSAAVARSLEAARERRKEDDVYDTVLQAVAFINKTHPPPTAEPKGTKRSRSPQGGQDE